MLISSLLNPKAQVLLSSTTQHIKEGRTQNFQKTESILTSQGNSTLLIMQLSEGDLSETTPIQMLWIHACKLVPNYAKRELFYKVNQDFCQIPDLSCPFKSAAPSMRKYHYHLRNRATIKSCIKLFPLQNRKCLWILNHLK